MTKSIIYSPKRAHNPQSNNHPFGLCPVLKGMRNNNVIIWDFHLVASGTVVLKTHCADWLVVNITHYNKQPVQPGRQLLKQLNQYSTTTVLNFIELSSIMSHRSAGGVRANPWHQRVCSSARCFFCTVMVFPPGEPSRAHSSSTMLSACPVLPQPNVPFFHRGNNRLLVRFAPHKYCIRCTESPTRGSNNSIRPFICGREDQNFIASIIPFWHPSHSANWLPINTSAHVWKGPRVTFLEK